jgi:hypothetical protein
MRFTPGMRLRSLSSLSRSHALRACAFSSLLGVSMIVAGCAPADDDDNGTGGSGATGGTGGGSSGAGVKMTDANNFKTLNSKLNIQTIETAPGASLDISWAGITNDILCHPVNAGADIDDIVFLRINDPSKENIAKKLDGDGIASGDLKSPGAFEFQPKGATSAKLKDFSFQGTPIDVTQNYAEDATSTYMLIFQKGIALGHGAVSMVFLKPTAGVTNTTVTAPSNAPDATGKCPLLDFSADLTTLTPAPISKAGPWILNWSGVKTDSRGQTLQKTGIDRMLIGFYANKTRADLQADFLNLEIHDTVSWEAPFAGAVTSASLTLAKNRKDASPFAGFDQPTPGTWIMGLFCGSCQNPAPLFVTILEPQ